jgi:branched-chain amino acid transport system permease protein
MTLFFQQLANGLTLGSVYALLAIGFSLIFGVLNLVTFAHGEVYMIGAFAGFFTLLLFPGNIVLAVVVGFAVAFLAGMIVERISFRPFHGAPHMTHCFARCAFPSCCKNLAILCIGRKPVDCRPGSDGTHLLGPVRISLVQVITSWSLPDGCALTLFIATPWGRACAPFAGSGY